MKPVSTIVALLVAIPGAVTAQNASATAREFFRAHTAQQWTVMANLMDTASIRLVREAANETIEQTAKRTETMAAADPVRVAALSAMMDRLLTTMISAKFARVTTVDELRQLSDLELASRWLEANSARHQVGALGDLLGGLSAELPGAAAGAQGRLDSLAALASGAAIEWAIVGEVAEPGGVTHVTYRAAGLTPPGPTGVLTFRNSGGRWRVYVSSLEDQLAALQALEAQAIDKRGGG